MQTSGGLLVPLALLGRLPATRRAELAVAVAADAARAGAVHLGSHVEKHSTHLGGVGRDAVLLGKLVVGLLALGGDHAAVVAAIYTVHWLVHVRLSRLSEDAHDHGTSTVSALVLAEVIRARELLAAVSALERLVVGVKRTVVTLKVFLTTEATRAESADEGLGRVLSQRLLATTAGSVAALGRSASGRLGSLRALRGNLGHVHSGVLGSLSGLVKVGRSITLLVALALRLGHSSGRVLRDRVLRGGGREAAAGKLLIAEALLAEEAIVLNKTRGHLKTLTLAAVEVDGLRAVVGSESSKLILNIKLEWKLESRQATEVGEVGCLGNNGLCLGHAALHHAKVILASRESGKSGVVSAADAEVPGVAHLVLRDDRPGNW